MDPLTGSRNEFKWLFGILLVLPLIAKGRKKNENGLVEVIGNSTNRYAIMELDEKSA